MTPSQSYREIPLTKGYVAIVDASDYEWLMQWSWYIKTSAGGRQPYAQTYFGGGRKHSVKITMHRMIMGLGIGDLRKCDHRNGDGLDNRRENLRIATVTENNRNSRRRKNNSSGFKGVSRHRNKFDARITIDRQTYNLGRYDTPESAAYAYAEAAKKYFGGFART